MTPMEMLQAENRRLTETIEELRYELAEARREREGAVIGDFVRRVLAGLYGLTGGEAEIIYALWRVKARFTGVNDLLDRNGEAVCNLASHIKRIRKRVGKTRIITLYGSGYTLSIDWRTELDGLWKVHSSEDQSFNRVMPATIAPRTDRRAA